MASDASGKITLRGFLGSSTVRRMQRTVMPFCRLRSASARVFPWRLSGTSTSQMEYPSETSKKSIA